MIHTLALVGGCQGHLIRRITVGIFDIALGGMIKIIIKMDTVHFVFHHFINGLQDAVAAACHSGIQIVITGDAIGIHPRMNLHVLAVRDRDELLQRIIGIGILR